MSQPAPTAPARHLNLFDTTNIIVGIIIGSSIYSMMPAIANNVAGPWSLLGVWALGGVLSLIGALCYTELATAYPKEGGDYVYLTRAFGRRMGFLFAWCQLLVVRPGSIGVMAYVFAEYAHELAPLGNLLPEVAGVAPRQLAMLVYAVAAIALLTGVNILGVKQGKWTQNLLSVAKFAGLILVCAVGLLYGREDVVAAAPAVADSSSRDFGLALVFVLFAYGGWNEMAYVGSEVRDPRKNILRALLLGTLAVAVCYLVANVAFLRALGFDGIRQSKAVAAEALRLGFGEAGGKVISLIIAVTALGAINGLVFTGARIYYAMGVDHKLYAVLGRWHQRLGTPVWSLVIQAAITLVPVVIFGLEKGAFDKLVVFTTPVFWVFMILVALSVYRLREIEPETPRPYRVPGYPFTPFVFGVSSLYMLYRGIDYAISSAQAIAWWTIAILGAGLIASLYDPAPSQPRPEAPA